MGLLLDERMRYLLSDVRRIAPAVRVIDSGHPAFRPWRDPGSYVGAQVIDYAATPFRLQPHHAAVAHLARTAGIIR